MGTLGECLSVPILLYLLNPVPKIPWESAGSSGEYSTGCGTCTITSTRSERCGQSEIYPKAIEL